MSHPVWVRGLKLWENMWRIKLSRSHPVWVRGLKHFTELVIVGNIGVAPRVGAWIETLGAFHRIIVLSSHPVWVRGLKLRVRQIVSDTLCRTPCGCVD